MGNNNRLSNTELRYAAMDSGTLMKILIKDFHQYTPEALKVARKVLASRGIYDIKVPAMSEEKHFNDN